MCTRTFTSSLMKDSDGDELDSDHRMVFDLRSLVWGFQLLQVGLRSCQSRCSLLCRFDCLDGPATQSQFPLHSGPRAPPERRYF